LVAGGELWLWMWMIVKLRWSKSMREMQTMCGGGRWARVLDLRVPAWPPAAVAGGRRGFQASAALVVFVPPRCCERKRGNGLRRCAEEGYGEKGNDLLMLAHWFVDGDAKKTVASVNSGEELSWPSGGF
jgi:hypothetical protein